MASFRVAGHSFTLTPEQVEAAMRHVEPEGIRAYKVRIAGRDFPPKQVLTRATGLLPADFTTQEAARVLRRLGFRLEAAEAGTPLPSSSRASQRRKRTTT